MDKQQKSVQVPTITFLIRKNQNTQFYITQTYKILKVTFYVSNS